MKNLQNSPSETGLLRPESGLLRPESGLLQHKDHPNTADFAASELPTSEEPNIYNFQESTVFSQYTIFFIQ
jgi:hypothetical protein